MVKDLCFEIIETCLNNCMFCSSNSNCNKTQIIKFEDFKRTIDYFMTSGGIEELSLSGGEPFLHPDLVKMVALGQTYFAIQTRKQELFERKYNELTEDEKRLYRRNQANRI